MKLVSLPSKIVVLSLILLHAFPLDGSQPKNRPHPMTPSSHNPDLALLAACSFSQSGFTLTSSDELPAPVLSRNHSTPALVTMLTVHDSPHLFTPLLPSLKKSAPFSNLKACFTVPAASPTITPSHTMLPMQSPFVERDQSFSEEKDAPKCSDVVKNAAETQSPKRLRPIYIIDSSDVTIHPCVLSRSEQ